MVSILGINFGPIEDSNQVSVNIATGECLYHSATPSNRIESPDSLVCTAPPGAGVNLSVSVTVAQSSNSRPMMFSYNPPVIASFSSLKNPTSGLQTMTVIGQNFGFFVSHPNNIGVKVGQTACDIVNPALYRSHTHVLCVVKAGSGRNNQIQITVSEQMNHFSSYHYDPPDMFSVELYSRAAVQMYQLR